MSLWKKITNWFNPPPKVVYEDSPRSKRSSGSHERRRIRPEPKERKEDMSKRHNADDAPEYAEHFGGFSGGRDVMSPEIIKSFGEFSQLLHNINIKMASQNDQNMALLRSLETLPAIIKDIPRARELEGDILGEILSLLKHHREDRLRVAERLGDVKMAMMAMEENSRSQISFFEGRERGHRDQMTMMRETLEREKKHHRNNLTAITLILIGFVVMVCAGGFYFMQQQFYSMQSKMELSIKEKQQPAPQDNMKEQIKAAMQELYPAVPVVSPAPLPVVQPVRVPDTLPEKKNDSTEDKDVPEKNDQGNIDTPDDVPYE